MPGRCAPLTPGQGAQQPAGRDVLGHTAWHEAAPLAAAEPFGAGAARRYGQHGDPSIWEQLWSCHWRTGWQSSRTPLHALAACSSQVLVSHMQPSPGSSRGLSGTLLGLGRRTRMISELKSSPSE